MNLVNYGLIGWLYSVVYIWFVRLSNFNEFIKDDQNFLCVSYLNTRLLKLCNILKPRLGYILYNLVVSVSTSLYKTCTLRHLSFVCFSIRTVQNWALFLASKGLLLGVFYTLSYP